MNLSTSPLASHMDQLFSLHLASYFARDQYILPALHRMQKDNIYTIGDLVKQSENELVKRYKISVGNRNKLRAFIQNFGLQFAS